MLRVRSLKRLGFPSVRYASTVDPKALEPLDTFARRHIGPTNGEISVMCKQVGVKDLNDLVQKNLPSDIHVKKPTRLGAALSESQALKQLKEIASQNKVYKSFIGMGYTDNICPPVILRNILENPAWYTQYTPYQAEISQGRLESLINYQTMVQDLTALPISNASLLDEATAAAEAMLVCFSAHNRKRSSFFVDQHCHPQTIDVVKTRAKGFNINVLVGDATEFNFENSDLMGVLVQYPNTLGRVIDYEALTESAHKSGALVVVAADILSLTVLKAPGEFGADIAVGTCQRFGTPLGYGGPHAGYFACKDEHKRRMPGRLVGVSKDANGNIAYRLSLQTREQHIRREKATSNICTAQALLANINAMYAVYHGPRGLKEIATRVNKFATLFAEKVSEYGHKVRFNDFFDTVVVDLESLGSAELSSRALEKKINVRIVDESAVSVTFDETIDVQELESLLKVFKISGKPQSFNGGLPSVLQRTSEYLKHPVFNKYHSETEMLRYMMHLQSKDLSLAHAMIPLGSCTMKLNATTEMIPVTWPEFGKIHPFAPADQTKGYATMLERLEDALCQATGFDAISLQPNSGAQGEYAGLRVIQAYLESIGQSQRSVCLIPVSAHGTNPASAAMCGMKVVTVKCLQDGNLDLKDLKEKALKYKNELAAFMVTYPSTYGVFEDQITSACKIIHENGGQVYMDGANLNAQMGLCNPAEIGADVCHLNLHKTFAIPHGGGGPGMGPIGVKSHLAKFLPGHTVVQVNESSDAIGAVSAAQYGSGSILPISFTYLVMMGDEGLRKATQVAQLNANYMMKRLQEHYSILYTNKNGLCAHEFIIDCEPFEKTSGIQAVDIAKRLLDYGFHSPTMSFPVANTLMVEPTESESKAEIDRFIDAMISIRKEIELVENGTMPRKDNVLTNAPHPVHVLLSEKWDKPYSREQAAFPVPGLLKKKFWPSISRVDDSYGDRNLMCSCPPIETYE